MIKKNENGLQLFTNFLHNLFLVKHPSEENREGSRNNSPDTNSGTKLSAAPDSVPECCE